MQRYNPKTIEPKWQKIWEETGIYKTRQDADKQNYYCLVMFPYPSGNLHVGHWYNFAPADTIARYNRMLGKNVLHPIGFDAFGLPAENAAIKRGIQPAKWTRKNIADMTKQLKSIGTMYDWDKVLSTADPDYYKWTQWLFLKLYEKGLAYKKMGTVNWCPKDQTVLANEQVVGDNNECERCGTPVVQKELEQWYYKITDYAEELLEESEGLDWPERVKTMQANWIGRSIGAEIDFEIEGAKDRIRIFTTRPDTIFGATFMVLAPEHPLLERITSDGQKKEISAYVEKSSHKTELERQQDTKKSGVFTGSYAQNPANGEKIPIWVSDFVLMGYGTGAIMAVPAHDERDNEFARQFDLPIKPVVEPEGDYEDEVHSGEGRIVNSGKYDGMATAEAREKMVADFEKSGFAEEKVNYRIRDWLVSRQRYWGPPIPIINCEKCGQVPVPEDQLPVKLPEDVEFEPTGKSPLTQIDGFVNTECPKCGGAAKRETDTLDTFVDSSWYFLRYPNTGYEGGAYDPEAVDKWMPVDHYIGGIEHAILHLLYSRFITKFLNEHMGLPYREPFKKLSNQGIILGPDGLKMSKSKGNVVDPDEQVASYGADSLRLYLMFMGPYDQGGPYDFGGIAGTRRFIERVWSLVDGFIDSDSPDRGDSVQAAEISRLTQKTVKKVTEDLNDMGFNTAVAAMMELTNGLTKLAKQTAYAPRDVWHENIEIILRLLAPMIPHAAEEMWAELGNEESVHLQEWPAWDDELIKDELMTIVVQVNGKVRANLSVETDASEEEITELAKKDMTVSKYLKAGELKKTIYVKDKLVNFVVA